MGIQIHSYQRCELEIWGLKIVTINNMYVTFFINITLLKTPLDRFMNKSTAQKKKKPGRLSKQHIIHALQSSENDVYGTCCLKVCWQGISVVFVTTRAILLWVWGCGSLLPILFILSTGGFVIVAGCIWQVFDCPVLLHDYYMYGGRHLSANSALDKEMWPQPTGF